MSSAFVYYLFILMQSSQFLSTHRHPRAQPTWQHTQQKEEKMQTLTNNSCRCTIILTSQNLLQDIPAFDSHRTFCLRNLMHNTDLQENYRGGCGDKVPAKDQPGKESTTSWYLDHPHIAGVWCQQLNLEDSLLALMASKVFMSEKQSWSILH